MAAAEEYRHIAEEFFRLAREAKTEEERTRFFNMALSWSQAAGARMGPNGLAPASSSNDENAQPRTLGEG